MGGADRATETLQTALINSGNSHNLVNLLLRNVANSKNYISLLACVKSKFSTFLS